MAGSQEQLLRHEAFFEGFVAACIGLPRFALGSELLLPQMPLVTALLGLPPPRQNAEPEERTVSLAWRSLTTNLQEWIFANNGDGYFNIVNGKVRVA
jgi:hypothetical protein